MAEDAYANHAHQVEHVEEEPILEGLVNILDFLSLCILSVLLSGVQVRTLVDSSKPDNLVWVLRDEI